MRISYAICACNEILELDNLLYFLTSKVKDPENEEIVVLLDASFETNKIKELVKTKFASVKLFEREFKDPKDFAEHKNYLSEQCCKGDIIFNIDADEIPQEGLMDLVQSLDPAAAETPSALYVPRINLCPGYTQEFLNKENFIANEIGWINWPDYQGRIYKRGLVKWKGAVHEKLDGAPAKALPSDPKLALWHVKSVQRQTRQNELYRSIEAPGRGSQGQ